MPQELREDSAVQTRVLGEACVEGDQGITGCECERGQERVVPHLGRERQVLCVAAPERLEVRGFAGK